MKKFCPRCLSEDVSNFRRYAVIQTMGSMDGFYFNKYICNKCEYQFGDEELKEAKKKK